VVELVTGLGYPIFDSLSKRVHSPNFQLQNRLFIYFCKFHVSVSNLKGKQAGSPDRVDAKCGTPDLLEAV